MIFEGSKPKEEVVPDEEVLEALEKLLADIEYLGKGEMDDDKADDVMSVLRLDSARYSRALMVAIRFFGGGVPKEERARIFGGVPKEGEQP